jgi:hypothetical protein
MVLHPKAQQLITRGFRTDGGRTTASAAESRSAADLSVSRIVACSVSTVHSQPRCIMERHSQQTTSSADRFIEFAS